MRYGLNGDLARTRDETRENNYFSYNFPGSKRQLSHEDTAKLVGKGWKLFVNIDGVEGKKVCPLPHLQLDNVFIDKEDVIKWDNYSCLDRFNEIKDQLTEEEQGLLWALLLSITGGKPDMKNSGLWDMIRSHAINGHSYDAMDEIWVNYKLKNGMSNFARKIFEEAVECGLDYTFKTHVDRIEQASDLNGTVQIHIKDGKVFTGRKTICTAPLNTLKSITFDPPFSKLRQEAIEEGHINFMLKAHAVVKGSGLASWNGACYPNTLAWAYGDGVLPSGDTHLVSFGADNRDDYTLEDHPEWVAEAFQNFHPMEVKKVVSHYPEAENCIES